MENIMWMNGVRWKPVHDYTSPYSITRTLHNSVNCWRPISLTILILSAGDMHPAVSSWPISLLHWLLVPKVAVIQPSQKLGKTVILTWLNRWKKSLCNVMLIWFVCTNRHSQIMKNWIMNFFQTWIVLVVCSTSIFSMITNMRNANSCDILTLWDIRKLSLFWKYFYM